MKVKSEREDAQSCPTLCDPMDWNTTTIIKRNEIIPSATTRMDLEMIVLSDVS